MTFALSQALAILQMPQQELGAWLRSEIEKNPLLELKAAGPKKGIMPEIPARIHLYEHLQSQIREHFSDEKELRIAEDILERLDERGFVDGPLTECQRPILTVMQTFDPPGIFARNLQEALILQLRAEGKTGTPAYDLVQNSYEDLLHGRYAAIKKRLGSGDLSQAMSHLARLSMRPAQGFWEEPISPVYPDLRIERVDGGWRLELIEDEWPQFQIQTEYLEAKTESIEEQEALRMFKTGAKWIFRVLNRRQKMLREIGRALICRQAAFLDQKGPLVPFGVKELAEQLGIHESTLSRALSGKYAATPRGLLLLRSLVTADPAASHGREALQQLIDGEDKGRPLTDQELTENLRLKGFSLARRTIAKYRTQLKIGSASQRKNSR